jgi:hypothetical protein
MSHKRSALENLAHNAKRTLTSGTRRENLGNFERCLTITLRGETPHETITCHPNAAHDLRKALDRVTHVILVEGLSYFITDENAPKIARDLLDFCLKTPNRDTSIDTLAHGIFYKVTNRIRDAMYCAERNDA